jgi:hypothetical protein
MDPASFTNNVLLLEERDYGSGVCPTGTFLAKADNVSAILAARDKSWLARLWTQALAILARLTGHLSDSALASQPNSGKLYCSVPGMAYSENTGTNSSLIFAPTKVLDASASYYLLIKGDENLESKTGILSAKEIGFNGTGYCNNTTLPCTNPTAGQNIYFNNKSYTNSQIIAFSTLSDQGPNAGLCAVDHVQVNPSSYLFTTTDNALASAENDTDASAATFDTVADKDKVFAATAYSSDNQIIQPVDGYAWTWNFNVANSSVVAPSTVANLSNDKTFISAQAGITDAETKLTATINMIATNLVLGGDGFNAASDIYVFICKNPWPPVSANGLWAPWTDTCQGSVSGNCGNYNYKFYYCRDAGTAGTQDDLPAIINQAVIRGASSNLICSADNTPCSTVGAVCGSANSGLCMWSVLKESYFFREPILSGGQIISATDQQIGGTVKINWQSGSSQVGSYKIYYLQSGKGTILSTEIPVASACTTSGTINNCSTLIDGLTNNTPYVFQVSVISVNKTESALSTGATATPTDQTPPSVAPMNFQMQLIASSTFKFTWTANTGDTAFYRLYHGMAPGQYGESFDSAKSATSLSFPLSQFSDGDNRFALTAVDAYKNESAKATELSYIIPPAIPSGLQAKIISTSTVQFSWTANTDNTVFYRLYLGVNSGQYGKLFDSARLADNLVLPLGQLANGDNYLALIAVDAYSQSAKSTELICTLSTDKVGTARSGKILNCHN